MAVTILPTYQYFWVYVTRQSPSLTRAMRKQVPEMPEKYNNIALRMRIFNTQKTLCDLWFFRED